MTHNPDFPTSNVNQHRPRAGGGPGSFRFGGDSTLERSRGPLGGASLGPDSGGALGIWDKLKEVLDVRRELEGFASGGGGGGGGGTRKQKIIDLDPFKNKELDAMRELLKQRTQSTRTELTGDRARIGNAFQRFEALRNRKRKDDLGDNRGSAQRRGFLDSGVFQQDAAEIRNIADSDISTEDTRSSTLVSALSSQIGGEFDYLGRGSEDYGVGTLEALRSAQEASSTADIERSYLNSRISQGGQG